MAIINNTGFPNGPLVDAGGNVTAAWRAFLLALFSRTGGSIGIPSGDAATQIAAEAAARQAADTALTGAISNEATARATAVADEAALRAAADAYLGNAASNSTYLLDAEKAARIAADAAEVTARTRGDAGARGFGAFMAVHQ